MQAVGLTGLPGCDPGARVGVQLIRSTVTVSVYSKKLSGRQGLGFWVWGLGFGV